MANNAWAVTTEKLKTSAGVIKDKTARYNAEYTKLYTELQGLKSAQWQGTASDAFNEKLDSYKSTFEQLETVLKTFAEGLEKRAKNYEDTEKAIENAAKSM